MNKTISTVINNESFWKFSKEIAIKNPILAVFFIIVVLLILIYALKIILKHLSKKDCDVKTYNFDLLISQNASMKELFELSQKNNNDKFSEIQEYLQEISKIPAAFEISTLNLINKIQEWQNRS